MRFAGLAVRAVMAVTLAGAVAGGQTSQGVRVDYSAAEGCPSREAFILEVGSRTGRLHIAEPGEAGRGFRVTLGPAGEQFQGTLVVDDGSGSPSERRVQGESCAVVGSALALVAALTIDPEASTAPLPSLTAPAPTPAPTPTPTPTPTSTPPSTPTPTPTPPSTSTSTPTPTPTPTRKSDGLRLGGAVALEALGVGSNLGTLVGPAVAAEVGWGGPPFLDPALRWAPEVRLGGSRFEGKTPTLGPGSATFTFYRVEASLCPLRLAFAASLEVRPCLVAVAGSLEGIGKVGNVSKSQTKPWFELGGSGLVDWTVVGPLGLEGEGGLDGVPLRNEFRFTTPGGPPTRIFQALPAVPWARLGLRVRFP